MAPTPTTAAAVLRRGILWLAALTTAGLVVELAAERHWTQPVQFVAWGAVIVILIGGFLLVYLYET